LNPSVCGHGVCETKPEAYKSRIAKLYVLRFNGDRVKGDTCIIYMRAYIFFGCFSCIQKELAGFIILPGNGYIYMDNFA